MTILGISTSTRLLGMGVISANGLLEDYRVCHHKSSWSPAKATLILSTLEPCVRQYSITRLILSIPPVHYQTKALFHLLKAIEAFCKKRFIECERITENRLHQFLKINSRTKKKALMQSLMLRYPAELERYYEKECRNKHSYYIKLFEAVGMATLALESN